MRWASPTPASSATSCARACASAASRRWSPTASCATSPACSAPACRCGARARPRRLRSPGLTFVNWQEPIGCGGVAVFPDDVVVVDDDGAVLIPAALLDESSSAAVEQERLEAWIMQRGRERRAAARPVSAERRDAGALRGRSQVAFARRITDGGTGNRSLQTNAAYGNFQRARFPIPSARLAS